jgi:hypothetical protein
MRDPFDTFVTCLADLPIYQVVKTYEPLDFRSMTKQQLVNILPSNAYISWNKSEILEEVDRAYNSAKRYFKKYGRNLVRLKTGQLCLMSDEIDSFADEQQVYRFDGLTWFPFPTGDHVSCRLQELKICTHTTWNSDSCTQKMSLFGRVSNYAYTENQLIYPLSNEQCQMMQKTLEGFKEALVTITAIS